MKRGDKSPQAAWQAAVAAYNSGKPKEAKNNLSPLLRHPLADANTFLLAGVVESQLFNWNEAESLLRKSVAAAPGLADGWMALGGVLQNLGRAEEAVPAYQQALKLNPQNYSAYHNIGVAYEDMGRALDALDNYDKALAISPQFEPALRAKAPLLGRLRRFDEASQLYQELLSRFGGDHGLRLDFAELLEQSNRPEDAEKYIPGDINPAQKNFIARAASLRAQLLIRKGKLEEALELLRQTRKRTGEEYLRFREGTILDRLGQYDSAITAFKRANKAVSGQKQFRRISSEMVNDHVQKKIDKGIETADVDATDTRLCFLVGLPRSGTTLLNRILDAHPRIQVLEELEALRQVETARKDGASLEQAQTLYWEIVARHIDLEQDSIVIDKSPYHAMSLDVIADVFPRAQVVMILRHPYDSALSCFMQDFRPGPVNAQFLKLESCAKICSQFLILMAQFEQSRSHQVTRIYYEKLVADFDREINQLLGLLGLSWHENIENYANIAAQSGPIMTMSYEQVTRKLYKTAINRWSHYSQWLESFDETLGPLLEKFGYQR